MKKSSTLWYLIYLCFKVQVYFCPWKQFDEQKDQVAVEQILRVVFLDPERPCPVSTEFFSVHLYVEPMFVLVIHFLFPFPSLFMHLYIRCSTVVETFRISYFGVDAYQMSVLIV